jgi:hypothetical protein
MGDSQPLIIHDASTVTAIATVWRRPFGGRPLQ